MQITKLWLTDFRGYQSAEFCFDAGLTAVVGPNGSGKTNLLEALGLLASLKSFRGARADALVRYGARSAFVRAEGVRAGREVLIELELGPGRTRAQVNRQRLANTRALLGALRVTVFSPDDLALLKAGPAVRRQYLDDVLTALDPAYDRVLSDFERALKQRNALLKQLKGRLDDDSAMTLEVWDSRLGAAGEAVVQARESLLETLMPLVSDAYKTFTCDYDPAAGFSQAIVEANYVRSWSGALAEALLEVRSVDVRRGVSTIGPHRDELLLSLNGLASRTCASQGEQRTLALALRLGGHRLVTERIGEPPLLLLDDVLSELDLERSAALLNHLWVGQTIVTSAIQLPSLIKPDAVLYFNGPGAVEVSSGSDVNEAVEPVEGLCEL